MAANQKQKNENRTASVLKLAALAVLLIVLIFAAAGIIAGTSFADTDTDTVLSADSADVIYAADAESVADLRAYENGAVLLTADDVLYPEASGNVTRSAAHSYSQPCMTSFDRKVLVYDRGNKNYRLEINAAVFGTYEAPGAILTATVGKKGNYAVATVADGGFQSKLYVYKEDGSLQYVWGSARNFITAIALSDSGKRIAVALVGSENAVYTSRVTVFEVGLSEPLYTFTYDNTTVVQLDFMRNDTIGIVTDTFVSYICDGQEEVKLTYPADSLLSADTQHAKRTAVLVAGGYSEESGVRVYEWDNDGDLKLDVLVADGAYMMSLTDRYVAVADEKMISVYDRSGKLHGQAQSLYAIHRIALAGTNVFCQHESGINAYSVHNRLPAEKSDALG